jgi:hypothetical protein
MGINTWKVIAIIFIILFIVETLLLTFFYNVGVSEINKEKKCQINICGQYDAYTYDTYASVCQCYKDNEIVKTEYIGGK